MCGCRDLYVGALCIINRSFTSKVYELPGLGQTIFFVYQIVINTKTHNWPNKEDYLWSGRSGAKHVF